jgi:hypothetical protein
MIDFGALLLVFLGVTAVVGVLGVAVGMLLIAPRLSRWVERDEDAGDGDD